tara:strand:+ start:503 stop:685 length:183 start_codon:yes stop_codon:yes gene_type:complete
LRKIAYIIYRKFGVVERTPEEWRQYHSDKSKRYYDKNKEKITKRKRELYNERVGNKKDDE